MKPPRQSKPSLVSAFKPRAPILAAPRYGVARVLSKQGLASRSQAALWVREGRVRVNGRRVIDPEFPVRVGVDRITLDGDKPSAAAPIYLVLNKPRGLITSAHDEQGRDTVYRCFDGADLPWLAPVGRLDKASEGLLLFSNDPKWASVITDPVTGPSKTYHVQINAQPDDGLLLRLHAGVFCDGELLSAASVKVLRHGGKNAWLEIVLDEGRNRQIRRLLAACQLDVLRLIRVAIGPIELGELIKGQWRMLSADEAQALANPNLL